MFCEETEEILDGVIELYVLDNIRSQIVALLII